MQMRKRIWTGAFWVDAGERLIGAGAGSSLALLSADGLGLLDVQWGTVGSVAGLAALLSLLKSLVAGTTGDTSTGGFTDTR